MLLRERSLEDAQEPGSVHWALPDGEADVFVGHDALEGVPASSLSSNADASGELNPFHP